MSDLKHNRHAKQAELVTWLIGPARRDCSPEAIVGGLSERLVAAGVALKRVRIGQRLSNPMIGVWGVIWTRGEGAVLYTRPRTTFSTPFYYGSPFQVVIEQRRSVRHSLEHLGPDAHSVYVELAEAGNTDYLALPIEYGDGSVQGGAFTTDRPGGFTVAEIALIESLAPAISAALEPAAMRHSMQSLLEVYLGTGPAGRVVVGAFRRGATTKIDAAVMVTDIRGFTGLSERLAPDALLETMGTHFEIVVDAVRAEGGDVLKFIGDSVLSIFPTEQDGRGGACGRAVRGIERAFDKAKTTLPDLPFVAALHIGPVVYGNIGSVDRLDFTVVGPTVNFASRLEGIAKTLDRRAVCSAEVARSMPADAVRSLGRHVLKGFAETQEVFELVTA
ncbi:adenylate/guanylate cyclase domain-containing protein [Mesorhizobium sp. VK24D]|uniref:Adenylate/guanylate cyclase domain-containing protein n=1 Tax=Mesorhizobium album TaxID=3072314 RepID=A0ABU4Y8Z9_9HYPH|nr:adenylate/guanylate cyclase domain-containing protein [Mesorhizobium sp. VK24D]MDX8483417.1 adenylate/guanylate cyclase domain-containing protein [Mesorhizobium sp. VK24D]